MEKENDALKNGGETAEKRQKEKEKMKKLELDNKTKTNKIKELEEQNHR